MTSTAILAVRVGAVPAACALALALAVQIAPTRDAAARVARSPIDAAAMLPPRLPSVPQPAIAEKAASLFELTLRTRGEGDLERQLRDAGAVPDEAARAAALLQARVGPELGAGADFKVGLGPLSPRGHRSIEDLSVITDGGMERVARVGGRLALVPREAGRRVSVRIDGGAYWALRRAGIEPDIAAEAARLADERLGAAPGAVITAVVGERPARFGVASEPRLLMVAVARAGQPLRRLLAWPGAVGRWIDPDRGSAAASTFVRPVRGRVTSGFGARFHPILHFFRPHRGLDFAAQSGEPVRAAADGCVVGAGWSGGYGRQVRLVHRDGLRSSYSHLGSVAVGAGECLRRGALIGLAGASGLATGPHLHFELHRGGQAVDPLRHLGVAADADVAQRRDIAARLARLAQAPS